MRVVSLIEQRRDLRRVVSDKQWEDIPCIPECERLSEIDKRIAAGELYEPLF